MCVRIPVYIQAIHFLFLPLLSFPFQGDLEEAHRDTDSKCVFLTIHDVLCNHTSIKVR